MHQQDRVLYHLTVLPPKLPACEAISQEMNILRAHFYGDVIYLNPNQGSPLPMPRLLFGFHQLKALHQRELTYALHHIYNADPFPYPVLRYLRRPVVYMIDSGIGLNKPDVRFFNSLAAVTVYDTRSQERLQRWGVRNVYRIQPGIDTERFTHTPQPLEGEVHLLVGSAPWTKAQFETKGVNALLAAVQQYKDLKLTFLWRGVLAQEMLSRVKRLGLEAQVKVINRQVDVNQELANVHASITLAAKPSLVKAYPHSLLDSLAAGKPVLVSQAIPMADYVTATKCGMVIDTVTPNDIIAAIKKLASCYSVTSAIAKEIGKKDFSLEKTVISFRNAYQAILSTKNHKE
ncbi:MAG: glycosyltransferase [Anaerolineae bacterium]|nr:glycosyltransferase [Anaerolineae bacterium]